MGVISARDALGPELEDFIYECCGGSRLPTFSLMKME